MPGTRFADGEVTVQAFGAVDQLPADAAPLLDAAPWQMSGGWWALAAAHACPAGARPHLVLARLGGRAAGLLPLWAGPGTARSALTTPYSCVYHPLSAAGLAADQRRAVWAGLLRTLRGTGVTRLDAIEAEWDGWDDLLAAARAAWLRPLVFRHFGNWYIDVTGQDFAAWLSHRPGALRETIRRRLRRAAAQPEARFELLTRPEEMDHGIAAYLAIYGRSWKEPEPFTDFNPALMRWGAGQGTLRLGLWWLGATPVAVQFWIVVGGRATVLKLAHDEAFRAHSPGTVLTGLMMRHLLDQERVTEIDFGRGDDPYKQAWTGERRQRMGVLLVAPWRLGGMAALARHAAGRTRTLLGGD